MTEVPEWVTSVPATPSIHDEPPSSYQWEQLSQQQIEALRGNLIESVVAAVVEAISGFLPFGAPAAELLGNIFTDLFGLLGNPLGMGTGNPTPNDDVSEIPILGPVVGLLENIPIVGDIVEAITGIIGGDLSDLTSWADSIPGLSTLLGWLGLDSGGDESTILGWAAGLLDGDSPLDSINLFNLGNLFGKLPIGNLTSDSAELLDNPDFREAISLQGAGVWTWDAAEGRTVPGSAKVSGRGAQSVLVSNTIAVAQGDQIDPTVYAKWTGLTYTGTKPVKLQIVRLLYDPVTQVFATMATDEVAAPASPAATQSAWFLLAGASDYTVPANTSHIALRLVVEATATAGDVWFDDASCRKTGLIEIPWVSGLPTQLDDIVTFAQSTLDHIFGGLFGILPDGPVEFMDIFDGLQAIPPANVLGLQGGTIVDTFAGTIDTLWGGFAQLFGTSGKSVFDVASLASETVGTATTGLEVSEWNNAILGNRTSESLFEGTDPTEVSNFTLDKLANGAADPTTLNAAAGFTPMAFYRAKQSDARAVVHWIGKGFTNVTSLLLDFYRFNYTTNQLEWFFTSDNRVGSVGSNWGSLKYVLPTPIQLNMGDTIAVGFRVVGSGTHSIAGLTFGAWQPNDNYVPYKQGAIRTDSAATTISFTTLGSYYSSNVPWLGLAMNTGDIIPDYHAPRTTQITTVGAYSYVVPEWADEVDEILCSGAGGGQGGDPAIFQTGGGGRKGNWSTRTLVRGTDFPVGAVTLAGTVGAGGPYGDWPGQDGENGAATTRNAITGGSGAHTAAGGLSGRDFASDKNGQAAGNITYNGTTYPGGGQASHGKPGATGQAPGGGGGGGDGGTWGVAWRGGSGARGVAIYVARQVD